MKRSALVRVVSTKEAVAAFPSLPIEIANRCFLGKVYYLSRRRNAYWGYKSTNHFPGSFALRLDRVKRLARVERGSQWHVEELPAIVLASREIAVLFVSPWFSRPSFSRRRLPKLPSTLDSCLDVLLPRSEDYMAFLVAAENVEVAELPFNYHWPKAVGGAHKWLSRRSQLELRPFLSTLTALARGLQRR